MLLVSQNQACVLLVSQNQLFGSEVGAALGFEKPQAQGVPLVSQNQRITIPRNLRANRLLLIGLFSTFYRQSQTLFFLSLIQKSQS